ncbi:MAG TPA: hypothetical protein GX010_04270 [Erysipelotrichaceae bacterium]|nr:hypothetical protein [Erysipelotrichaceae bacterium]
MITKYIKRLVFKEWLPITAVFGLTSLALFITHCLNVEIYKDPYYYGDIFDTLIPIYMKITFDFVYLSIPISIFALVMPIFVYSYRFKIQRCDTYYQLPFAPKRLKNIRLLTGLGIVLAIYTTVFILGFTLITILYYCSPATKDVFKAEISQAITINRATYNPLMLLATYGIGLLTISGVYFQSCFFTSLTNTVLSALVLNMAAQTFFSLIGYGLFNISNTSPYTTWVLLSPSIIGANGMVQTFSYSYVLDPSSYEFDIVEHGGLPYYIPVILCVVSLLIFAVFAIFVILEKDPSGESAGQPATRNKALDYIIYGSIIAELLAVAVSSDHAMWFGAVITGIVYFSYRYLISSLFFHSAKLSHPHYIIMGISSIIYIVLSIC